MKPKGLLLFSAVAAVAWLLGGQNQPPSCCFPSFASSAVAAEPSGKTEPKANPLPRLLDLGAGKCIPCKMMTPILEELKKEYAGRLQVEFIDVWQDPDAAKKHKVQMIPTQIFFDAAGKELYRHEGFFAKAEILAKWKALGVELGEKPNSQ